MERTDQKCFIMQRTTSSKHEQMKHDAEFTRKNTLKRHKSAQNWPS